MCRLGSTPRALVGTHQHQLTNGRTLRKIYQRDWLNPVLVPNCRVRTRERRCPGNAGENHHSSYNRAPSSLAAEGVLGSELGEGRTTEEIETGDPSSNGLDEPLWIKLDDRGISYPRPSPTSIKEHEVGASFALSRR